MRRDCRLSGVLHVLLHMAEPRDGLVTSEALARLLRTNAVVVRRLLSGLRDLGFVRSGSGHGGGWMLARDLAEISLRDIYDALGEPSLLAIGNRTQAPDCLVKQAVNASLDAAFREAEDLVLRRLGEVTLAELNDDFRHRFSARGEAESPEAAHG